MLKIVILIVSSELSTSEFDTFLSLVTPAKREHIKRYKFFRDAQNSLLGDLIARTEIRRATGLTNDQLDFSTNKYGKPFLKNNPHIYFNISHTEQYVAFAIASAPVGIDYRIN